jgi:hypothetical protein
MKILSTRLTPVCAWCLRVREGGVWIKRSIDYSKETLTHGCCPECVRAHYPEVAEMLARRGSITGAPA